MPRGNAIGYVYAIHDPRLPKGKDIVFVGNGARPWESIQRHLTESSNPRVAGWAKQLWEEYPTLTVLGQVVCDQFHGDPVTIPPPPPHETRLEWSILALEEDDRGNPAIVDQGDSLLLSRPVPTKKAFWIRRLLEEGHPLLNNPTGRPRLRVGPDTVDPDSPLGDFEGESGELSEDFE